MLNLSVNQHSYTDLCRGDRLEAAEVLVMLVKATDHHSYGVVRGRDQVAFDGIGQGGPVFLQELQDSLQRRCTLGIGFLLGQ